MKKIEMCIAARQSGSKENGQPAWFMIDGETDDMLLFKTMFNASAVYLRSQYEDEEFETKLKEVAKKIKTMMNIS